MKLLAILLFMTAGCRSTIKSVYNGVKNETESACNVGNISARRPGSTMASATGFLSPWKLELNVYTVTRGGGVKTPDSVLLSFMSSTSPDRDIDGEWVMLRWPEELHLLVDGADRSSYAAPRTFGNARYLIETMDARIPWPDFVKLTEADDVRGQIGLATFDLTNDDLCDLFTFRTYLENGGKHDG